MCVRGNFHFFSSFSFPVSDMHEANLLRNLSKVVGTPQPALGARLALSDEPWNSAGTAPSQKNHLMAEN